MSTTDEDAGLQPMTTTTTTTPYFFVSSFPPPPRLVISSKYILHTHKQIIRRTLIIDFYSYVQFNTSPPRHPWFVLLAFVMVNGWLQLADLHLVLPL